MGIKTQVETPIRATQTAEAKLTELAPKNLDATATIKPVLNATSPASEIFIEDFSKGSQYWGLGTKDDDCKTASLSIANNALRWQLTAKTGCVTAMGYPKLPISSNIDLRVTFNLVNSTGIVDYGLIFRRTDDGSYRFYITTDGRYALIRYNGAEKNL